MNEEKKGGERKSGKTDQESNFTRFSPSLTQTLSPLVLLGSTDTAHDAALFSRPSLDNTILLLTIITQIINHIPLILKAAHYGRLGPVW